MHGSLVNSIDTLNQRTTELQQTNDQLKSEILERKQAEKELQKLASVIRYSSELVNLATPDGKMVFLNEAGSKMLGIDSENLEWTNIIEVIPDHLRDLVQQELLPTLMDQRTWEGDLQYRNLKTGELTDVHATTFTIQDPNTGEPLFLANVSLDITERKQAEEALRKSEEKFRQLADLLPQVVFETDEKGNLTFANRVAFEFFGYTEDDFKKGLQALEMIIPEERDMATEKVFGILGGAKSVGTEYTALRKDGTTYPALIYANPIISEGKAMGIRGIMADLTEFKHTQEALRESEEKLVRSKKMEALGLLAGGVAHDLNNILSGIVSYPELILMDLPEGSKLRKPVETMQESGQRAAAIVQDLLTMARGVATAKEPLNVNSVIEDYLNSPEFEKLKKHHPTVTVKTNLDPGLLSTNGSYVHIRKVIMNLVSNASEAIQGSGNVAISTMNRYVDKPIKGYDNVKVGEYVTLSVSDDGSGISSDDIERIFDPFYTKKVMGRSGTGLGLSVVWNVVQDHAGYIDVISNEDGTEFELYFPITRDKVIDKALGLPIEELKGNGETILVVDDMESQREISCEMLDALGYRSLSVAGGKEAIEYLKEHTVDLVLLDMIMDPGMNGRETYEGIIKLHPKQRAIIVSGFSETDDVKEIQKLGAGRYVKKPFTLEEIGMAVKEELKK